MKKSDSTDETKVQFRLSSPHKAVKFRMFLVHFNFFSFESNKLISADLGLLKSIKAKTRT